MRHLYLLISLCLLCDFTPVRADTSESFIYWQGFYDEPLSGWEPTSVLSSKSIDLPPLSQALGSSLSAGMGVSFAWSFLINLSWRSPLQTESVVVNSCQPTLTPYSPNSMPVDTMCTPSLMRWFSSSSRGEIGIRYRPLDWISPVFIAYLGVARRTLHQGYEVVYRDQKKLKGINLDTSSLWTLTTQLRTGLEWRFASVFSLGGGGYLDYDSKPRLGIAFWIGIHRYLRWK